MTGELRPGTLVARTVGDELTMGPKDGRTVLFGRQTYEVHLCVGLDDTGVSRKHGVIGCADGRWSLRNLGRRPLLLPSGELHTNAEPVPLADGHTPVLVNGSGRRQHLLEVYVVGSDGRRPFARPDQETHHPTIWALTDVERRVLVVLAQRYLRYEPRPQPLCWKDAADDLQELDPGPGWNEKKAARQVLRVRERLSQGGVVGLWEHEIAGPAGNQINDNLIRELIRTSTLRPGDLDMLDELAGDAAAARRRSPPTSPR